MKVKANGSATSLRADTPTLPVGRVNGSATIKIPAPAAVAAIPAGLRIIRSSTISGALGSVLSSSSSANTVPLEKTITTSNTAIYFFISHLIG